MKQEFFDRFAQLHRSRVNNYFATAVPFDEFINSFIYVNAYDEPDKSFWRYSKKSCEQLKKHLDCQFYGSELEYALYNGREFVLGFSITARSQISYELTFNFEIGLKSEYYDVDYEWVEIEGPDDNPWNEMLLDLEGESMFGTIKRAATK
jgi:hypothetical protein